MTKTICDICGKDMYYDSLGLRKTIDTFNFAMSRNGKYMDICQDCRDELLKWMESRKENTDGS